jgi:hypothetical protein
VDVIDQGLCPIQNFGIKDMQGGAIDPAVSRRSLTTDTRVRIRVCPCGTYGGQSDTRVGFSTSSSVFSSQYDSTVALHTHISLRDEQ